jgi:serine/threonine protein kinase
LTPTAARYALLGRLATGGMAELFLARKTSGRGVVVLKRIKPKRLSDPRFVSMFLDEAKLAAQLDHDNIARVHDIGKLGESYFFTMEYIHGEDVRTVLGRLGALGRTLPIGVALYIGRAVSAGLHYAHERTGADGAPLHIVHRDVSPSNVMLGFDGGVKLVDFGVAKAAQRTVKTEAGAIKGKVTYFSPEQCRGRPVDRQSDVYSLGIVLHEMLTGKRLYKRETDYHTMRAILAEDVAPPSKIRSGVPASIDEIVLTALAKEPANRYATAGAITEAIEAAAAREGIELGPTGLQQLMKELFGARPVPWLELAARDEQPSMITVTSVLDEPSELAKGSIPGTGGEDHATFLDEPDPQTVETELARMITLRPDVPTAETNVHDTEVSGPSGEWTQRDPEDEWHDEAVAPGELRPGAAADPAEVIAAVQAATGRRAADTTAILDTVAPLPSITGSHAIGDKRMAIQLPVARRRIPFAVALIAVFLAAAVVTALALR